MAQPLTSSQEKRRRAIKALDEASHLHLFEERKRREGRIALSRRGIFAVGGWPPPATICSASR